MNSPQGRKRKKERKVTEDVQSAAEVKYTRSQTGLRILASLFFGIVIWSILEALVFLMVIFQIIHALIAQRPNSRLIGFANHTIAYFYRVMRYLTFNEEAVPFPFSGFPAEIEEPEMK